MKTQNSEAMVYIDTDFGHLDLQAALASVSAQRREAALRFKHECDQRLSVAVYLLLKRALKEEYGIGENPVFGYEKGGKPFIKGHPEIHFNMSHCRHAAACAVSDRPIGIDVETIRPYKDALARYVLNDEEWQTVTASSKPEEEFTRLWTMKESLLKLMGTGLRQDLKTLLPCHSAVFTTTIRPNFICTVCQSAR